MNFIKVCLFVACSHRHLVQNIGVCILCNFQHLLVMIPNSLAKKKTQQETLLRVNSDRYFYETGFLIDTQRRGFTLPNVYKRRIQQGQKK